MTTNLPRVPLGISEKEIIIFDLDGTLAPSKSPLEPDVAEILVRLLEKKKVCVVSGGNTEQFKKQFLNHMPETHESFSNLIIMPTSGARMLQWDGEKWVEKYAEELSGDEKEKIIGAINASLDETGFNDPDTVYGAPIIEDRGTQVTFSALGQGAPIEAKEHWDSDQSKRKEILEKLKDRIPEFSVYIGGMTSIDITRKGVDKGFAINKLIENLNIPLEKMLFVGDKIIPGGNDYSAKEAGVDCIPVADPEETKKLIASWLE